MEEFIIVFSILQKQRYFVNFSS